ADLHGAAAMADVQRTAPDQVQLAHAVNGVEGVDAAQRAGVEDLCAYREALQQDGESVAHLVLPVNFSGLYAADRSSRGSTLLPAVPPIPRRGENDHECHYPPDCRRPAGPGRPR